MSPSLTGSPASEEQTPKSSSEKKRLRDRRAQRTLRERRERQLKLLQEEVAEFRRLHNSDNNRRLTTRVQRLEGENETLRRRHEQLQSLLDSWKSPRNESPVHQLRNSPILTTPATAYPQEDPISSFHPVDPALAAASSLLLNAPSTSQSTGHALLPIVNPSLTATVMAQSGKSSIPVTQLVAKSPETPVSNSSELPAASSGGPRSAEDMPLSLQVPPPLIPAWMLTPSDDDPQSTISMSTSPWLLRPDLIAECPDLPAPLDLLHGSRRNFLANGIHQSLRLRYCRDPEVLAMGWLLYVYAKWRVAPSARAYAVIPPCMRPVMGQLQKAHPSCLDQIIWPQLRLNIMDRCPKEKLLDVMNLLSCCLKVRWKWGESILERDDNDDLQIRPSFFDTFKVAEGWGLTSEFSETHPDLVDGIEPSQMLYIPT